MFALFFFYSKCLHSCAQAMFWAESLSWIFPPHPVTCCCLFFSFSFLAFSCTTSFERGCTNHEFDWQARCFTWLQIPECLARCSYNKIFHTYEILCEQFDDREEAHSQWTATDNDNIYQLPLKLVAAWTYICREESLYICTNFFGCKKLHRMSANWGSSITAWSIQNQHTSCKVLALRDKCRESE